MLVELPPYPTQPSSQQMCSLRHNGRIQLFLTSHFCNNEIYLFFFLICSNHLKYMNNNKSTRSCKILFSIFETIMGGERGDWGGGGDGLKKLVFLYETLSIPFVCHGILKLIYKRPSGDVDIMQNRNMCTFWSARPIIDKGGAVDGPGRRM